MSQFTLGAAELVQDVPEKVVFPASYYRSTSDMSLNRRQIESVPIRDRSQWSAGDDIEFQVSSDTAFIDWTNSYIRGEMVVQYGAATGGACPLPKFTFDIGGVKSLFDHVRFQISSTQVIPDECMNLNLVTAMKSKIIDNPEYVDAERAVEWDSACANQSKSRTQINSQIHTPSGNANYGSVYIAVGPTAVTVPTAFDATFQAAAAGPTTAEASSFWSAFGNAQVGDVYNFVGSTDWFQVQEVVSGVGGVNATIVLRILYVGSDRSVPAAANVMKVQAGHDEALRHRALKDIGTRATQLTNKELRYFTIRPELSLLEQQKYFPIWLYPGGIRISMRLDPKLDHRAVQTVLEGIGGQAMLEQSLNYRPTITIQNVRFVGTYFNLHSEVNDQYLQIFENRGFLLPFTRSFISQDTVGGTEKEPVIQMNVGARSMKSVISRIIPESLFQTNSAQSVAWPVLSATHGHGLYSFQYSSGNLNFPDRAIDWQNQYRATELQKQLQIFANKIRHGYFYTTGGNDMMKGGKPASRLYSQNDQRAKRTMVGGLGTALSTGAEMFNDQDGIIMSAILARDPTGKFAGLDGTISPLQLRMKFDNDMLTVFGNNRLIQTIVFYDAYLHTSAATGASFLN